MMRKLLVVILLLSPGLPTIAAEARRTLRVEVTPPLVVPPTEPATLKAAIDRGIDFLVRDQNRDGSWGTAERTKDLNIYAPVPEAHRGYRAAVTGLCVLALVESQDRSPATLGAIERGEQWLLEYLPKVRRSSAEVIYNVWAHAYGIAALVKALPTHADDASRQQRIRLVIADQVEKLVRYEAVDGGWGYYDFQFHTAQPAAMTTSFMSATVLIALHDAQQAGIDMPRQRIDRALASILRQQKPDLSYLYGEYLRDRPLHPVNQPGGSLGRTQACNAALRVWGDERITDELISKCLDRLFARNLWLDLGRKKPIPHESYFAVAGYFYYYGHFYAALCIDLLPAQQRAAHQHQLAWRLLRLQEKDGSWWDYPLYNYHQQYGTAFAIMSLVRCRK